VIPSDVSPVIRRYAALFNERDWDSVREMLIDDVRLDVVQATTRRGRKDVGVYFTNYASRTDWLMVPARLDGRQGLAVLHLSRIVNFVELTTEGDCIAHIRDFHHVPYLTSEVQPKIATSSAG
jgi:RNA polymerase sigma-70 factor (ECF subfamily)